MSKYRNEYLKAHNHKYKLYLQMLKEGDEAIKEYGLFSKTRKYRNCVKHFKNGSFPRIFKGSVMKGNGFE